MFSAITIKIKNLLKRVLFRIFRLVIPENVLELLIAGAVEEGGNALSSASRDWAGWIVRDCAALKYDKSLYMPLVKNINSDNTSANFFDGENIVIMQGTIISDDSRIGANSYVGYNCHVTKSQIGRYVSVGNNVMIGQGEHVVDAISTSSIFYSNAYESLTGLECVIQHDVWIGSSSIIRRGVNIGIGSIIGANSFVNCDVAPFSIMVGSPAKCIGFRFNQPTIESILRSGWWEHSSAPAKEIIRKLINEIKQ